MLTVSSAAPSLIAGRSIFPFQTNKVVSRQLPSKKTAAQLGLGIELLLRLRRQFSSGATVLEPNKAEAELFSFFSSP